MVTYVKWQQPLSIVKTESFIEKGVKLIRAQLDSREFKEAFLKITSLHSPIPRTTSHCRQGQKAACHMRPTGSPDQPEPNPRRSPDASGAKRGVSTRKSGCVLGFAHDE
ncbi:hypothetical protein [methane-oxidizing endosymbiont of Gigantopelta aegis]|uniref:hypothetical protein n=1 Tax=methane-oxidizing endosymbiont of Gigantopelta aegis TaxID=2794938 RepID=UPI0018DB2CD5|nr:hypothetical protein [methane-oxidizing endosymbiont of Gigantopelta aegis]